MAALQWIKENIQQFGGDPKKVTLFGHGTGAACIEYLVYSPTTVPGKRLVFKIHSFGNRNEVNITKFKLFSLLLK